MQSFTRSSDLPLSADAFLSTLTLAGVNRELMPLCRMTAPAEWAGRPIQTWPVGRPLFHSWILLCGIIPVDRHRFRLRSLLPGGGFDEASTSLLNSRWEHQREVTATDGGCRVTDRVAFSCRVQCLGRLLKPVYALVFLQRHRRLRLRYGVRRTAP